MKPSRFYAGLFVVAACTLMLQVVQTRILSVVAWYHLAFFAISMAMFGMTAGAVWLYLRRERYTEATLSYHLSHYSAAFAVSIAASLLVQLTLSPIVSRTLSAVWTWMELALCIAVPFFFSGIVVSLALTRGPFPIGRVYGADLFGAASGCLGALVLLNITDGPSAVLLIAMGAVLGAVFFAESGIGTAPAERPPLDGLLRHRVAIFAVLALAGFGNGLTYYGLQPLSVKGRFEDGSSHIYRQWNTFSRISVIGEWTGRPHMWGPSPRFATANAQVTQRFLEIDGDAGAVAYRFSGNLADVDFLKYDITTLGYRLPGRDRTAIIGIGGGRDILSAALFGSRDITGIEINPAFVRLLAYEPGYADFTNLGRIGGVRLVVDEGRSWLARSDRKFDRIQMSVIDSWAATSAGAFSLSENGLYTVEAWRIFLDRLSDKGVLTVSRWYDPENPAETGRLLSLAVAALLESGATAPERHIFLAASDRITTIIVARQPFSAEDVAALRAATADYQFRELVVPSVRPESAMLREIVGAAGRAQLETVTASHDFDLTPATDDRPFFFNQVPLSKPLFALSVANSLVGLGPGGVRSGNLVATATLLILFCISLVLVVATVVAPLRPAIRDSGRRLVLAGTAYFLLIGVGFMTVEIALLQRMSIFLGHPVYSLGVSLFTLILASGAGSALSDRLPLDSPRKFLAWGVLTGVYVLSVRYWLPQAQLAFESAPLLVRSGVCMAVIAPAGLLMGFAFPSGMRLVAAADRRPTPWFWGINGAAGVLASVLAVATNIALGISATFAIGAACYLLLIPAAWALLDCKAAAS